MEGSILKTKTAEERERDLITLTGELSAELRQLENDLGRMASPYIAIEKVENPAAAIKEYLSPDELFQTLAEIKKQRALWLRQIFPQLTQFLIERLSYTIRGGPIIAKILEEGNFYNRKSLEIMDENKEEDFEILGAYFIAKLRAMAVSLHATGEKPWKSVRAQLIRSIAAQYLIHDAPVPDWVKLDLGLEKGVEKLRNELGITDNQMPQKRPPEIEELIKERDPKIIAETRNRKERERKAQSAAALRENKELLAELSSSREKIDGLIDCLLGTENTEIGKIFAERG